MRIDPDGIPRRIAYWRVRRGLSQEQLALRMDPPRTRSWVAKVEARSRQADFQIGVLEQVAAALNVPAERLLCDTEHRPYLDCVDEQEAAAIRAALSRYDVATSLYASPAGRDPVAVDHVARDADYGWASFQAAHFAQVARLLPRLIVEAAHTAGADGTEAAWTAASCAFQLAAAVSVKFADGATATLAAERGVASAERSGDPITIASAARRNAEALLCLGDGGLALDLCLSAARRLESDLRGRGADGLSVLGSLYLKGAVCAAAVGDRGQTMALIGLARQYATMLGYDGNAVWSGFGPTNVAVHEVATLAALEEGGRALDAAALITPDALGRLPRERQAHHLGDLAIAQIQAGRYEAALSTLLFAEGLGRQEVHCRPRTRETIARLADAVPVPGSRLRALAQRSGVVV